MDSEEGKAKRAAVAAGVAAAKEAQQAAASREVLVTEDIDDRLSLVLVEPNAGEEKDENIPRNLHNGVELLLKGGKADSARRLQQCVQSFFRLFELGPNSGAGKLGRACVCWSCGHCGLEGIVSEKGSSQVGVCMSCGETRTNYVQTILASGMAVPWVEASASPPESSAEKAEDADNDEDDGSLDGFDDHS
ncbi:unnamed protein product, partial [Polarella glacialis]